MPLCWLQVGLNHENAFPSILELEGQKGVSVISPSLADGCVLMLLFLCVFISGISYFLLFLAGWGGGGLGGRCHMQHSVSSWLSALKSFLAGFGDHMRSNWGSNPGRPHVR